MSPMHRRRFLSLASAFAISPLVPTRAAATAYPARPVRVVVGFPAGGGADILTRVVTEWLQARLGQPFVVENKPGAGTNLATESVVRAPADGYTLLATTTSNLLNGNLYDNLAYDFRRDMAPVASISTQPLVFEVHPGLPVKTVPEFIAYARANPGSLNVANTGTGTVSHLAAEALKLATGVSFTSVPYRGATTMLPDLISGRVQAAFDNIPGSIEHIRSNSLRALAVTSATRSDVLPGVPALAEFVPDYEVMAVAGLAAPAGTPPDIVDKLNREVNAGLADPKLKARLAELGVTAFPNAPADFGKFIAAQTDKWSKVIRSANIKVN